MLKACNEVAVIHHLWWIAAKYGAPLDADDERKYRVFNPLISWRGLAMKMP
jgi:hypothetical protein